jgi:ubiquinone/menaquinone biosynthesis C-methylase UbiE
VNGRLYDLFGRIPERRGLAERRARLVAELAGEVLELGAGTGFTLPHYRRARHVVAVEPDASMAKRLRERAGLATVPVEVVDARGEALPFPDESFDAVVATLVLCSVGDVERTLAEIRRVLRPRGSLVFIEHVRGEGRLARWQDRLTPLQVRVADGCHLNRDTGAAIAGSGFEIERMEEFGLPGGHPLVRPAIQGVATRTSS